jgi:predicted nucleic acid-binding protein
LRRLFEAYAFFQRCDGYEQGTVDFLLAERTRKGARDRGEVEAVVQASQFGATVIVDDPWGRELAERFDLEPHGTLWVLQQFHELGLLPASALRQSFVSLRLRGTRLPWGKISEFLLQIGQPPL